MLRRRLAPTGGRGARGLWYLPPFLCESKPKPIRPSACTSSPPHSLFNVGGTPSRGWWRGGTHPRKVLCAALLLPLVRVRPGPASRRLRWAVPATSAVWKETEQVSSVEARTQLDAANM